MNHRIQTLVRLCILLSYALCLGKGDMRRIELRGKKKGTRYLSRFSEGRSLVFLLSWHTVL